MKAHVEETVRVSQAQIKQMIAEELDQAFQQGFQKRGEIDAIAMNDLYHFGVARLHRTDERVSELVADYNGYAELREGIADMKIKERLRQIGVTTD